MIPLTFRQFARSVLLIMMLLFSSVHFVSAQDAPIDAQSGEISVEIPESQTIPSKIETSFIWRVYTSFPKDQLQVRWVVTQLDYVKGTLVYHRDIPELERNEEFMRCSINGKVDIHDERAFFQNGYIHCELPNFREELWGWLKRQEQSWLSAHGVTDELRCLCDFTLLSPPWFAARFGAEVSTTNHIMPLAVTELSPESAKYWRFQLQINTNAQQANTQLLLEQWPDKQWKGNRGISEVFDPYSSKATLAFSGYGANLYLQIADFKDRDSFMADPNFIKVASQSPYDHFLGWVQEVQVVDQPIPINLQKLDEPKELYIGYNGRDYFEGWISNIVVDPGCVATK